MKAVDVTRTMIETSITNKIYKEEQKYATCII